MATEVKRERAEDFFLKLKTSPGVETASLRIEEETIKVKYTTAKGVSCEKRWDKKKGEALKGEDLDPLVKDMNFQCDANKKVTITGKIPLSAYIAHDKKLNVQWESSTAIEAAGAKPSKKKGDMEL